MSLPLSSLRSHFFKHLTYCNSATTFFSFIRRIHGLPPPNRFSSVPSARAARQLLLSRLNVTAVNCSTLPLHSGTVTAHDAFNLHYLSVRICCPRHVAESFHPVEITEGLWIVPEWRNPPFGADLSVGFDIERQAITSARHNAALNNIGPEKLLLSLVPRKNGPQFENECPYEDISSQDLYNSKIIAEKDKYDVVIANILLYPLLDLAEQIVSYAKPGAVVGVSGIISEQVPTVVEHYSQFLEDINVSTMDDWACITGSKKTEPGTA
ncbi:UNVERIFIED_CONTAM: Ribosomal protein L11 methyltransferase [Sesamum latifolium]|uniref:ETFB lysine methyltransferase n=1 Tax=Sesamum latifolium TaxID=2727402 RepID=A0AAW2WRH2_9LAMI